MDLLAVNQHAGPYLTIITKMTRNMFFIVVMMAIVLLSFGVSRKAILSPNSEPSWSLARDVVFQPYWMIYGEVYASEMDVCFDVTQSAGSDYSNIYFDMAATSNKLWKYNRYRYIMTYQDRPWLPPPMVLLSHVVLLLRTICRRCRGAAEGEEGGTGLKLFLGCEDRKLLHEFEEKCVEAYFQEKSNDASSNQMNRIRTTAERVEEMNVMVEEVSEKVNFIQDSLLKLDSQLGQLQDLSALAVDTLTMLSASDSQLQEEVRLAQCQPPAVPWHVHPHSWTQSHRDGLTLQPVTACRSSPPSLLKNFSVIGRRRASPERHSDPKGGRVGRPEEEGWASVQGSAAADQTSCEPWDLSSWNQDSSHAKLWTCDPNLLPNPEEISMEEEEEEEDEDGLTHERLTNVEECAGAVLSTPCGGSGSPAFVPEDNAARCHSRISSQWRQAGTLSKWGGVLRGHPYGHCRSLSSSMENITFSSTQSPKRTFRDEASLQCSRSRDWSEPYDFAQVSGRGRGHNRKTVKIQESKMPDAFWRRRAIGEAKCWSASASLSQLYLEPLDIMQKTTFSHQDVWSPPHSEWKSWVTSMSRRSSLQGGAAPEVKGSWFQSSETLYPHYSAVERNNLMRLATSIPFTPVSILGGEEVSIYSLEELPSDGDVGSTSISSWASRGLSAILQPLSSAEGSLDGGLRQGCRVLCTWAEQDVLRPGLVYVVKAFRPEVLGVWQQYFHGSTSLQLCLREIQQQRAAQKLMQVFNRIRPRDLCPSPSFLDVSLLLCPSSGHWFTIERNMCGEFRKYNNNSGEEIAPCCSLEELLLAFSHWTFEGEMLFGPDNLGDVAIKGFLQRHCCRTSCSRLGLTGLRKNLDRCEETAAGTSTSV
ncbi:hypothetical protein fugu_004544 [Takifugu bimaculatus]|uniref:non-specific serine/threonine protein kinase n=1 Tax=Takifugu bimaculatus TaxID=433685 RepID=A0A4Z2BGN8_9TELE|nr:hypothetical protein fugu_004544 [Takifugu bimaculatus]